MATLTESFSQKTGIFKLTIEAASALFDSVARGRAAAHEYQRLSRLSDAQLAVLGFDRITIQQQVVSRHLDD